MLQVKSQPVSSTTYWLFTLKKYAYLIFLIPTLMPFAALFLGFHLSMPNLFAYATILVIFGLLPVLDYVIGHDSVSPSEDEQKILDQQLYYRWLTLLCLPLLYTLVFLGAAVFSSAYFNLWGKIGWVLSVGIVTGGIGIVVAHELVHKNTWYEKNSGGLLLALVCYGTFKVEHLRGHHVCVGTELDASTAKYNQSLYSFLLQTFRHNFINGWRLEILRLKNKGLSPFSMQNELLCWYGVSITIAALLTFLFGWQALAFFLLQSFVAITLLEITNYIEHYGLQRKKLANGRYEHVTPMHSWNSDYLLSNLILFQLQRHSDHHVAAKRRYQSLIHKQTSPQLPAGYPTMVLLALVPPLWYKIIHASMPKNTI